MVRLVVSLVAMLAAAAPAFAGDRAALDVIGYSQDAQFFAFEEFGIQDGSGYAYSSIYIVDLGADTWVVGTPIRLVADDDATTLQQIRNDVRSEAENEIAEFGIEVAGDIVALLGDGVPDGNATSMRFGVPGYNAASVIGDYELRLSQFPTTSVAPCQEWFSIDPKGYQLALADGGTERVVHRDGALPRSRGCPSAYRLYGVVLPFMAQTIDDAVALISVYPGGFEGPDRRFIAVPLGQ